MSFAYKSLTQKHTHTHTHTYAHTHIHTHTHTRTHIKTGNDTDQDTLTGTRTHTQTDKHTQYREIYKCKFTFAYTQPHFDEAGLANFGRKQSTFLHLPEINFYRAGHFRYFLIVSITKIDFFAFFIKLIFTGSGLFK